VTSGVALRQLPLPTRARLDAIRTPNELPGVELRHLAALEAIAQTGTISAAASRLGYSQSAVSQQLAALERLVGSRLVERTSGARLVVLTPAGERLAAHAVAIRQQLAKARADIDAAGASVAGVVRIGTVPSIAAAALPAVARAVRSASPSVAFDVSESYQPDELVSALRAGRYDFVLAAQVDPAGDLDAVDLGRDRYVLLARASHRLTRLGRPLRAEDLAGVEFVAKRCGAPSQRAIDAALGRLGLGVAVRVRAHDARTVRELVAAGLGVAIVPELLAETAHGLVTLELDGVVADRAIALVRRRGAALSQAAQVVADAVIRIAPRVLAARRAEAVAG
jgi:molybdate transport repressor ModE-like protein